MGKVSAIARRSNPATGGGALVHLAGADLWDTFIGSIGERTRQAYAADLAEFAAWLGTAGIAGIVGPAAAAAWLVCQDQGTVNRVFFGYQGALRERRMSAATINRRRAALRSVLAAGRLMGLTMTSLEVRRLPDEQYRDTAGPDPAELQAMLRSLERKAAAKNRQAVRDLAIVRLLFLRGLRKGEVLSLDLEHWDPARSRLFIHGKARSGREWVTIPQAARAAVEVWVSMRGPAAGPLFQTCRGAAGKPTGGRLSERHINRILAPYGVRPHGLRHSAITLALELTGGDITKVAKFSRHKNVATVLIYDDHRQDMGGQVADLLAASQPATVPDAPAVTAADLAVLTNTQRARVALLLAGCTVAAVAAGEGVGKASVVESVEQAEVKIPSLHAALEMAGVRRPRKAV